MILKKTNSFYWINLKPYITTVQRSLRVFLSPPPPESKRVFIIKSPNEYSAIFPTDHCAAFTLTSTVKRGRPRRFFLRNVKKKNMEFLRCFNVFTYCSVFYAIDATVAIRINSSACFMRSASITETGRTYNEVFRF